jgi:hypothetical protein
VIKAGGSRTLRLAGGAGLAEGGGQVGNWLCESCTAKHCLKTDMSILAKRVQVRS